MFATIYLPDFFLQAAMRHQSESRGQPVALIGDQDKKAVIIQLNGAAEEAGVRIGMSPSQGLARTLALVIKVRSSAQEKILQDILLHLAGTLSPYVEETAAGIATVQFTDTKNALRNVTRVIEHLRDADVTTQAGLAPTPDASFLAAHLAQPVLQIDDVQDFLAPLLIETLALG